MRYFRKKQKSLSVRLKIILIFIILLIGVSYLDSSLRPILTSAARLQGINKLQSSLYNSIRKELENLEETKFIKISKTESGGITSVETDMIVLNNLVSELSSKGIESLKNLDNTYISIPSGILSGISFLSGVGFPLKFRILTGNHLKANVSSDFSSAGINQTIHRIVLNFSASLTVFLHGKTITEEVPIDIILAETIIVGETPESFSDINLLSSLYEKTNSHNAEK